VNIREMQPCAAARPNFELRISIFVIFLLAGCGAPGDPRPPRKVVPAAIVDLSARQQGEGVALSFAAPQAGADGEALPEPPEIEIYRGRLHADGTADPDSFRMVYTAPGAMLATLSAGGQVRFRDVISAEELRAHPGAGYAYRVRSRVSKKRASGDSNTAIVRLYPPPERVSGLAARLTESAIRLAWNVAATGGGAAVSGYRVYRGELEPGSAQEAAADASKAKWKSPPALLGPAAGGEFADTQFVFGATYLYTVRAVSAPAGDEANSLESPDSAVVVEARDIFPPGAPQGLVAVYVPGGERPAGQAELSWTMNTESDLAGYRAYRSEKEGTAGTVLTPELLPTPAFRDNSIEAGHHYRYTVTAVDRSGNESAASGAADMEVAEAQP
jgi:hypothetical protein